MTVTERKRMRSPSQPVGRWIRVDLRLAIYLRDAFRCVYCCRDLHGADPRDVALDHIIPRVDGGSNKPANLVTSCRSCNCSRQDTPVERYCGPETLADIKRLTARPIAPFRTLAKAIISGEAPAPGR
jgi:5-methylcytosine-specific restriction endonuclease McrA